MAAALNISDEFWPALECDAFNLPREALSDVQQRALWVIHQRDFTRASISGLDAFVPDEQEPEMMSLKPQRATVVRFIGDLIAAACLDDDGAPLLLIQNAAEFCADWERWQRARCNEGEANA
jgi:hypothetical protein